MESFKTVVINVAGDTLEENDEGFSVTLSNPTNGVIGTAAASGTIFNDDATVPVGQSVGGTLGPDVQVGGPGNDDLLGSPGPDVLDGASGTDRANYAFSPAGVTADLVNAVGYGPGDAAGDTYISIENVRGSDFVDILIGTVGNDVLEGMGGDDILIGSLGADVLSGGDGRETFAISSVSEGGDIIADFNPAINEVIDLRTLFTAHGLPTGDPVGQGILAVAPLFGLHSVVNLDLDGAAGPSLPFTLYTLVNVAPTALDFDIHFAW
jgi:Ca2+-binding RTX toxin-like protein